MLGLKFRMALDTVLQPADFACEASANLKVAEWMYLVTFIDNDWTSPEGAYMAADGCVTSVRCTPVMQTVRGSHPLLVDRFLSRCSAERYKSTIVSDDQTFVL